MASRNVSISSSSSITSSSSWTSSSSSTTTSTASSRGTPPLQGPSTDAARYRDLLLFEERLKSTAASLQRRKRKYLLFLVHLLVAVAFLAAEVLLPPRASILAVPYRRVVRWGCRCGYRDRGKWTAGCEGWCAKGEEMGVPVYVVSAMLLVGVTALVLFFASGMYAEKVGYANKYVPHANRSLRTLNMYLNMRQPPLRSKIGWTPLGMLFPRPASEAAPARARSPSSSRRIGPMAPTSNPRGELKMSSRVDRVFREGYERYRAAFERRRAEKEREKGWWRLD